MWGEGKPRCPGCGEHSHASRGHSFRRKPWSPVTKHCVFTSHCPGRYPHEGLDTHPTLSGLLCALVYPKPSAVGTDLAQGLVCERGDFQNTVGETPERPLLSYCELLIPHLPGYVHPTTVNGTKKELHTRCVCLSCIKLFRRVHACLHV